MNVPLVSVIIPTYNRAHRLGYCIESVLNQTYPRIEVIVVDDCSNDNTVNLVRSYGDKGVRYVRMRDRSGAQAARNGGIREARGDWISFQDSDDEWLPGKLTRQMGALAAVGYDPLTVVHSNVVRHYHREKRRQTWRLPKISGPTARSVLLGGATVLFPTVVTSRTALERISYLDERAPSHQEWDTAISLSRCCSFIHIEEPLVVYHIHEESSISKSSLRDVEGWSYIITKHANAIKGDGGQRAWNKHVLHLLRRCLDFRLWEQFDRHITMMPAEGQKDVRFILLVACRFLHIKPSCFMNELLKLARCRIYGRQVMHES